MTEVRQAGNTGPCVAYAGPSSFPNGGAAARRILGNALALRDAGYRVAVGSGQIAAASMREYLTAGSWLEVESLGERMIAICRKTGAEATTPEES